MDQNSNAADLLFDCKTIAAIEDLVETGKLPDGHATVLYLKMVNLVYEPIKDPNFLLADGHFLPTQGAPPFDSILSMWTGLYCFRFWRTFIKNTKGLTLGGNFCSLESYETVEATVHGCTNHVLVCKRHKAVETEWRLAAPCRNVATTTRSEGTFGATRVGKIGHHNSVNCTLKGFMDTLSKVVGSQRAKQRMEQRGVRVSKPRNKEKVWALKTADQTEMWKCFADKVDAMTFDNMSAELSRLKAIARVKAKELITFHAPLMAVALDASGDWDVPFSAPAPWREELGESFSAALVSGDAPVLLGKLPLHPDKFPLDKSEGDRAEAQLNAWKQNLRQQDVKLYEAGCDRHNLCLALL